MYEQGLWRSAAQPWWICCVSWQQPSRSGKPFLGLSQTWPNCLPAIWMRLSFPSSPSHWETPQLIGFQTATLSTSYSEILSWGRLRYSCIGAAGLGFGELSKQKKLWRSKRCWHLASQHAAAQVKHRLRTQSRTSPHPPIDKPRHFTCSNGFSSSLRCFQSQSYLTCTELPLPFCSAVFLWQAHVIFILQTSLHLALLTWLLYLWLSFLRI